MLLTLILLIQKDLEFISEILPLIKNKINLYQVLLSLKTVKLIFLNQ